ncbi:MAG TPA: oligosaccharide flippase family protein [Bacteroidales bacterium]|nr:oligosaccharide flippase family protein [Bacteroidales bacterium]HSA42052.1 oligosaccharide flippase family protein [Bacteroidales bacterium]
MTTGPLRRLQQLLFGSQLKKNVSVSTMTHGLNILIALVSYPVYIRFLGFEQFSLWVTLSVVITFAMLGELGISNAIVKYIANAMADDDRAGIRKIISNSYYIVFLASAVIQILILLFNNQIIRILSIPPAFVSISRSMIPLIGAGIFTFLVFDVIRGVITGMGRLDLSNLLLTGSSAARLLFSVVLLSFKPDIFSLIYGVIITNVLLVAGGTLIIRRQSGLAAFSFTRPEPSVIKALLHFGSSIIGIQVSNLLSFPIIKILLARMFGLEYVGFFELATKAAYAFRTLFEKGLFAIMPDIAYLSKKNAQAAEGNLQIYRKVLKLTRKLAVPALAFFILLSVFSGFLLKLWLGPDFNSRIHGGFLLMQPAILAGLLLLPAYYALMASGREKHCMFEAMIRFILTIGLMTALILWKADFMVVFVIVSISVIVSNSYIAYIFFINSKPGVK